MTTEERTAQGPTALYCPNSGASLDLEDRRHHMVAIVGSGKLVRTVERCDLCGWIDFAALDGYAEAAIKESMEARAQRIAVAAETEPFSFVQRSDEKLTFEEVVFQALGAASMCWINQETGERSTGHLLFDSTRAKSIGLAFMEEIRLHEREERREQWGVFLQLIQTIRKSQSATPLTDLSAVVNERLQ
jgi:hypothetical protein